MNRKIEMQVIEKLIFVDEFNLQQKTQCQIVTFIKMSFHEL